MLMLLKRHLSGIDWRRRAAHSCFFWQRWRGSEWARCETSVFSCQRAGADENGDWLPRQQRRFGGIVELCGNGRPLYTFSSSYSQIFLRFLMRS